MSTAGALLLALLTGCGASGEGVGGGGETREPGTLVVIGGGLSAENESVYGAILQSREGDGPLCVVPTAGADPEASARSAVTRIDRWGGEGTALALPLSLEDREAADRPETVEALRGCSAFFFTGGVQSRILEFFLPDGRESAAYHALVDRWEAGAGVSGSSAGAAMMSHPMIAGGPPAGAFTPEGRESGGVQLTQGMGFLPDLLVDQHFLARGRIGRLVEALGRPGAPPLAAGIDEDTALLVRGGTLEVVGSSGVVLLDARPGALPEAAGEPAVRMELLGPGDRVSLEPGAPVTPGARKVALPGVVGAPPTTLVSHPGLFERWAFLHQVEAFARGEASAAGDAPQGARGEGARFHLEAGDGFRALGREDGNARGPDGSTAGLSTGPFVLRVEAGR